MKPPLARPEPLTKGRFHAISATVKPCESPGKAGGLLWLVTGVVRLDERVIFLLDLEAIVAALHPGMAIRMDEVSKPKPPQTYRILHVDDSSSIRRLVLNLLEQEGRFEVVQAMDGKEAWELLLKYANESEHAKRPLRTLVQGVITDIEMPAMDGLALCKRIKEHPVLRQLPVAMFSSLINESLAHKCESVGADGQFTKPDLQGLSDKMYALITSMQ